MILAGIAFGIAGACLVALVIGLAVESPRRMRDDATRLGDGTADRSA